MIKIYDEILAIPVEEHLQKLQAAFSQFPKGLPKDQAISAVHSQYPHLKRYHVSYKDFGLLQYFKNRKWLTVTRRFGGPSIYNYSGCFLPHRID